MWKLQTVWRYRGMTWPNISWTEKHSAWMRRGAHTPVGGERVLLLVRLIAIRPFTPNASCTSRTSYLSLHSSEVSDKALQTRGIELKIKNTHIQNRNVEWGKYFPAVKDESVMQKSKIDPHRIWKFLPGYSTVSFESFLELQSVHTFPGGVGCSGEAASVDER